VKQTCDEGLLKAGTEGNQNQLTLHIKVDAFQL